MNIIMEGGDSNSGSGVPSLCPLPSQLSPKPGSKTAEAALGLRLTRYTAVRRWAAVTSGSS